MGLTTSYHKTTIVLELRSNGRHSLEDNFGLKMEHINRKCLDDVKEYIRVMGLRRENREEVSIV